MFWKLTSVFEWFAKNRIDYLFVTNSLTGGGAERAINIAVGEISKAGLKVGLLAINSGSQDLVVPKVPTFEMGRRWKGGPITLIKAYVKTYLKLIILRPRTIILNCELPELFGAFLFGAWNLVVVEHSTRPWAGRLILGKFIRRILLVRKVRWVKVSDHLRPWRMGPGQATHIPNAIPQVELSEIPRHKAGEKIQRLVFIGRLTKEQKQPQWILEISELTGKAPVFYGDGLYREELEQMAKERKINASFRGFVNNPWGELQPDDLLIIPSQYEADGLVIVEAISRGVPILMNQIRDLTRFGLPNKNYCTTVADFVGRVKEFENSLSLLIPDTETSKQIVLDRNPNLVGKKWVTYLTKVD